MHDEGCRSFYCPRCCLGLGLKLKSRALPVIESFESLRLLTLTVDQKGTKGGRVFAGPGEAFDELNPQVGVLIKNLARQGFRIARWFKVFEAHAKKESWPHWHVAIESGDIPHDLIAREWQKLGGGFVWIGRGPAPEPGRKGYRFKSKAHAANYLLKYLIKPPRCMPPWLEARHRSVRRYDTSRGFFGPSGKASEEQPRDRPRRKRRKSSMTLGERRELCCSRTIVREITKTIEPSGEVEVKSKWLATVPLPCDTVLALHGLPERCEWPNKHVRTKADMTLIADIIRQVEDPMEKFYEKP